MKQIAMVLLFDRQCRLLVYLRDDKPDIPFPNHWDFSAVMSKRETPEEALIREVKEEIGVDLKQWLSSVMFVLAMLIPISSTFIGRRLTRLPKN